ncbi:aldo/keto reductase [Roseomonas sp. OT10]|uniref:aldo/keto reductase n=1 Tax=Roseomonas cutis TaxID=2897332 RepID=UPI001E4D07FE|nr:aldo/keto reductase [Roseomonas sp. OT10]UFN47250.1 aldo/keto reductase [Roseomonas sp. OT10]
MERRPLGRSGLSVPPFVFGGNVLGWTADEPTSFRLLDRLVEAGFDTIDTADVYSAWAPGHQGGESETVLGNWLARRGRRDDVKILTKVGMKMGSGEEGLSPAWIRKEIDASLQRLKTDYVDLYQAHKDDPDTPLEDTLATFAELIKAGKVRAIGCSNYSGARLKEALEVAASHGLPRYESLQPSYHLMNRAEFETDTAPVVREAGLGVISYHALAAGFLTGKYRSKADLAKSPRGKGVEKYLDARGERVLAALDAAAAKLGATQGQVALAWVIARPDITAPIASATSLEQLEGLIAGATLRLDADTMAALDAASA